MIFSILFDDFLNMVWWRFEHLLNICWWFFEYVLMMLLTLFDDLLNTVRWFLNIVWWFFEHLFDEFKILFDDVCDMVSWFFEILFDDCLNMFWWFFEHIPRGVQEGTQPLLQRKGGPGGPPGPSGKTKGPQNKPLNLYGSRSPRSQKLFPPGAPEFIGQCHVLILQIDVRSNKCSEIENIQRRPPAQLC